MRSSRRPRGDRGRGSIYQRKSDGIWMAQVQVGYYANGKPKYKQIGRRSHADALAALEDLISAQRTGQAIDVKAMTVAAFLDEWLQGLEDKKEPSTIRYYKLMVDRYIKPDIGRVQLRKLTGFDVQRMLDRRSKEPRGKDKEPLSPSTVAGIRRTLRAALTRAWKLGLVPENAAQKTDPPKVRKADPVYLTAEESAKLLAAAKGHCMENLIALALGTGLRVGEATGIRWCDVDSESGILRVTVQLQRIDGKLKLKDLKSASSRRVLPLLGLALTAVQAEQFRQAKLKAELGSTFDNHLDLVFLNEDARPFDQKYVNTHLKKLCLKAEVKQISSHKLRHSAATIMVAAGVPLALVKDQLGHSSITLTARTHAHTVPAAQREAACDIMPTRFEIGHCWMRLSNQLEPDQRAESRQMEPVATKLVILTPPSKEAIADGHVDLSDVLLEVHTEMEQERLRKQAEEAERRARFLAD